MGIIAIVMNFVLESRKRNLLIHIIGSLESDGGEDKLYILRMLAIPFVLLNDSFFLFFSHCSARNKEEIFQDHPVKDERSYTSFFYCVHSSNYTCFH